jgi:ubiquinone/menaquinone biosynthesis C-methylase UbiE
MNSKIFASIYETLIWRRLHTRIGSGISMAEEVQEVLEMSGKDQVCVVADLACGTGHYARAFAKKLPEALIYGMDISLSMLEQGRKKAQREGLITVTFLRGDIYQLPFENESVDWVNCSGTLHLFPNLAPIWREISRILRPSGVFTAMTITLVPGLIHKLQKRLMDRGRATFFNPHQLSEDLDAVGLSSFQYKRHGVSLIFRAVKT